MSTKINTQHKDYLKIRKKAYLIGLFQICFSLIFAAIFQYLSEHEKEFFSVLFLVETAIIFLYLSLLTSPLKKDK